MSEGRDEKGRFPYEAGTIERMKFKYPESTIEIIKIDIKKEEERTVKELEELWQHQ